jgi:hypothetical protein
MIRGVVFLADKPEKSFYMLFSSECLKRESMEEGTGVRQYVQTLAACLILAGTYCGVQRPSPVALFLAKAFALAFGASELIAGDLITVQFHGVHGPRDLSFRVKGLGAVRVNDVGTLTAAIIVLAWAIWMAVVVRDLLRWRVPAFVHDNFAEQTRAPLRHQRTTEETKEAVRIMASSRNLERMRIAVKVRREWREWRAKQRTRRDQPEADEVWRDAPGAPCSKRNDDHSGMQSASSPASPASILRSASEASSLSSAGRSSPAGRRSVRFRYEISELRYYDCEASPSHDMQLQLATALSSSQGGVYAPMSSPARMSCSQRLGPSCSSTSACDLERECLDEIVQSDGRVTTEAERLRELEHWLHKVQRFVATKIPDSV